MNRFGIVLMEKQSNCSLTPQGKNICVCSSGSKLFDSQNLLCQEQFPYPVSAMWGAQGLPENSVKSVEAWEVPPPADGPGTTPDPQHLFAMVVPSFWGVFTH